jgi:hypothetical protein
MFYSKLTIDSISHMIICMLYSNYLYALQQSNLAVEVTLLR